MMPSCLDKFSLTVENVFVENNVHVCTCLVQACCRKLRERKSTTSTVASGLATSVVLHVCEKKVRVRSSENLWVF